MLLIIARCTVKSDCRDAYIRIAEQMAAVSSAEDGCVSFRLLHHHLDPNSFVFVEQWRDQAAVDAHNQSVHFLELVPQMREMRESGGMDIYEE